jgi:hypothetical protein
VVKGGENAPSKTLSIPFLLVLTTGLCLAADLPAHGKGKNATFRQRPLTAQCTCDVTGCQQQGFDGCCPTATGGFCASGSFPCPECP